MNVNAYINRLDESTNSTLNLVRSISAQQLAYQVPGKWNILQTLEHICMTEKLVHGLLKRPSQIAAETTELVGDDKLKRLLVDLRARKLEAPGMLLPKGQLTSISGFEFVFVSTRKLLKENLLSGDIVIDNRVHKHPVIGEMTISDWLNFTLQHTQRHLEQLKDILSSS